MAEQRVDEQIARYTEHKDNSRIRALFHGADRPREEQVAEMLQELHSERQMQQEIASAIEAIRTKNRKAGLLS